MLIELNQKHVGDIRPKTKTMKLIHGDCLKEMKILDDDSVDLVLIDPPYNIGIAEWDKIDDYYIWMEKVFSEIKRVLKKTGSF